MKQRDKSFPLLFSGCLLGAIALHALAIYFFYNKTFWIAKFSSWHPFKPQENVSYEPEKDLLEGVFNHLIVVSPEKKSPDSPFPIAEKSITIFDPIHHPAFKEFSFSPHFSLLEEEASKYFLIKENTYATALQPITFPLISPSLVRVQNADAYLTLPLAPVLFAKREKEAPPPLAISVSKEVCPTLELPIQNSSPSTLATYFFDESSMEDKSPSYAAECKEFNFPDLLPSSVKSQHALSALENYKLPLWHGEMNWNDLFTVDVQVMPRSEQEGVYFAITLQPKAEALQKALKQNFHFIIDATGKTEAHRITSFKRALSRATQYLAEGQTFNIYVVDKQIDALAESSMEVSKKNLAQAREFLEKDSKTKVSSKGSLFSLLEQIHAHSGSGMDTVILLTDGGFLKERKSAESLRNWLMHSGSSSFVLHVATAGNKPHSAFLDTLAASSGGKVLHSTTNAAFPRKFSKLVLDLKAPIAIDLSAGLDVRNKNLAISLMGTSCKLPPLFASQPTIIYGVANASSSFTLELQGWNHTFPVELAFEIDLEKGRRGHFSMKHIALQDKAEHELSLFLSNKEGKHLQKAVEFLESAAESRRRM